MLLQLDPTRFIQVYIAQGFVMVVFAFIAYKILKRDTKRLNVIFSMIYIANVIGTIANFIYAPLSNVAVVTILNFVTNFCAVFGLIFLVIFELIVLKSEKVITVGKQWIILILYGIASFGMFFFLLIPGAGVDLNPSTEWKPVWNLPIYIYAMIVLTIAVVPSIYLSIKISNQFEDKKLKRKWNFFILGMIFLYFFPYAIFTSNFLNISSIRTIIGLICLVLAILGGYFIYYGVGRQIER